MSCLFKKKPCVYISVHMYFILDVRQYYETNKLAFVSHLLILLHIFREVPLYYFSAVISVFFVNLNTLMSLILFFFFLRFSAGLLPLDECLILRVSPCLKPCQNYFAFPVALLSQLDFGSINTEFSLSQLC